MGSWIINKKQSGHHTIKRSAEADCNESYLPMVADVYGTDEEARLIAAAPDLLAAMKDVVASAEADCPGSLANAILAGQEAIWKVKGGE
tara:strand:+ start:951 stop:1217 length:267 start_codon:yes stop_codon:yes gene_type:complete